MADLFPTLKRRGNVQIRSEFERGVVECVQFTTPFDKLRTAPVPPLNAPELSPFSRMGIY